MSEYPYLTGLRVCGLDGCDESIAHKRSQARFCCPAHRAAHHREKAHSTAPARPRRASRDGHGAHIYLTAQEIDFLENNRATFRSVADWQAHLNLGRKLSRAKGRLR